MSKPAAKPVPGKEGDATISQGSKHKADASRAFLENHYMGMLRSMNSGHEARPVGPRQKEMTAADFTCLKLIGRGAFGEVYIVKETEDNSPSPKLYAMKRMKKSEMLKKRKVPHVRSERNVMAEATRDSPWIVDLHFSFQDETCLYMVMDYMPGGDMMTWLCNEGIFSVEATVFYIAELALSVNSVHEREYVHRDIKPDNILMDAHGHTRLSDFGLCKAFPKDTETAVDLYSALEKEQNLNFSMMSTEASGAIKPGEPLAGDGQPDVVPLRDRADSVMTGKPPTRQQRRAEFNSVVGSPGYIAPEILNREPYSAACDWWSVGVIMYEMLYGRTPFYSEDPQRTCYKITHWRDFLQFPSGRGVPETAVDLMRRLLCGQNERITMDEIKKHPFFEGVDWDNQQNAPAVYRPQLNHPLDVRYFPPQEELQRPANKKDDADDTLKIEDPRGVMFADFKYDSRLAPGNAKNRSASTQSTNSNPSVSNV